MVMTASMMALAAVLALVAGIVVTKMELIVILFALAVVPAFLIPAFSYWLISGMPWRLPDKTAGAQLQ
jgi:hypothetical protein